ncbi:MULTISPECIES: glutamate-5-semialdehyde dehydrogenase [Anaerofustis]|uniref:glutamate-5-semialdehyde dehydrogenase n=1 Tax=Anaerofustis TaxID=264995 RepID=UPI001485BD56|nr:MULTISPECIES: glutamate-5-semialdehyde dehydrogenase [Anaerofustis]MCO8194512.1 glutamate-5-semialdehyde dehydrogenase [Anaerofustis sp. NSJ-163]
MFNMASLGKKAKIASRSLMDLNTDKKNEALRSIKEELILHMKEIIKANTEDISAAKINGIKESMVDRLMLNEDRIKAIAGSIDKVINLSDPVGIVSGGSKRPNGMEIVIKRVPYGVVGIIFESRPNVTVDAGCLCLKSGNACILRGGKEAINTNTKLVEIMRGAIRKAGLNHDIIQLVTDTDRKYVSQMAKLTDYIDVLIPRGSAGLIKSIKDIATVPFIETGAGNCHIYIDEFADNEMAVNLTDNGKTQRPSVCNALETLLVHEKKAKEVLPLIYNRLKEHNVEFRGDEKTIKILGSKAVKKATEDDYKTEYNDYIIAVKVVESIEEAINHINKYSTKHSECIVTNDISRMNMFTSKIDSACVYVNVSTRFTDGEEFGFGSEIGIATQRTLPRGPMGLNELTTIKYIITGNGQIRK